jgi:hypothetical protein
MDKQERIRTLQEKIFKLTKQAGDDVHGSYKEAIQSETIAQIYQKELDYLLKSPVNELEIKVVLKDSDGQIRKFTIVEINPDPSQGKISNVSEIGKKLLEARVGDTIKSGDKKYELISK